MSKIPNYPRTDVSPFDPRCLDPRDVTFEHLKSDPNLVITLIRSTIRELVRTQDFGRLIHFSYGLSRLSDEAFEAIPRKSPEIE